MNLLARTTGYDPTKRDSALTALGCALAAIAISRAVDYNGGAFHQAAFPWLKGAVMACAVGLVVPRITAVDRIARSLLPHAVSFGVVFQLYLLTRAQWTDRGTVEDRPWFIVAMLVCALVAGSFVRASKVESFRVWVMIGCYVMHAASVIKAGMPHIDVYSWHVESFHELDLGHNPYSGTMPDIYGATSPFYGPGLIVNGRVAVGYPYPPLSLVVTKFAHELFGDYRYAFIALNGLTAALIAFTRPTHIARAAAALFLSAPQTFVVLHMGWTDPAVSFGIALTVFTAVRYPPATAWAYGVALALKQYVVIGLPVAYFTLFGRLPHWKRIAMCVLSSAIAGVTIGPFLYADFAGFMRSVVEFQARQPFRKDSLSFPALDAEHGGDMWPYIGFVGIPLMTLFAMIRGPRSAAGFAATTGMLFLLFFSFGKQAFNNYYFAVFSILCTAVAAYAPRGTIGWFRGK